MTESKLPIDALIEGDCIEVLESFPERSIDLIFADPPYNLQLQQELWRPNHTRVAAVVDDWDQFSGFRAYDEFTQRWLSACRRVLKENGTLWVIGTYHNIFRVGSIMQDLGFWFLNDIIWIKTNPMPNFRGVRFTNAHETLLWACRSKGAKYTFNHKAMKALNDDLQMRSDWLLPICTGPERLKENGKKVHSTQKPEALLYRILLAASRPGDIVLDPFFGTGTTGAVAKKLHRHWIGIEKAQEYVTIARQRIEDTPVTPYDDDVFSVPQIRRREPRLSFGSLLEHSLLQPGEPLYFQGNWELAALVRADGHLTLNGFSGSIHQAARRMAGDRPCSGWECWYYAAPDGSLHQIDELRQILRLKVSEEREE